MNKRKTENNIFHRDKERWNNRSDLNDLADPDHLEALDQLSLQQTERLLSEVKQVTLPEEDAHLKAKVLARAGIQMADRTHQEAEHEEKKREDFGNSLSRYKKHRRFSRRAAVCIAAILVCSMAAIGAAYMDGLQRFWGEESELYFEQSQETAQSTENSNVKFNLEGVVADRYQCVFVLSVEALTVEGQRIIKKADEERAWPELKIIRPEGRDESPGSFSVLSYTGDNANNNDYKAYNCAFPLDFSDLSQPVTVGFDGLTLEFKIPHPMQAITLYPDSKADVTSVDISPIGFYYSDDDYAEEIQLIKKDGTPEEEMGYDSGGLSDADDSKLVIGSFRKMINLDDYQGIRLNGVNYTKTM